MKAADLPADVRYQVLGELRRRMGNDQYDQMADTLGEDGMLDLVMERSAPGSAASPAAGWVARTFAFLLQLWWIWLPLMIGSLAGPKAGENAFSVCFSLHWIVFPIVGAFLGWLARFSPGTR